MKRFLMWGLALAVGLTLWLRSDQSAKGLDPKPAVPETLVVARGDLRLVVESAGRVVPELDVEIKCKATGEVTAVPFDVSDTVKEGDLLVELDPVEEERTVQRSEITLASSRARLAQARQKLVVETSRVAMARRRAQVDLGAAEAEASRTQKSYQRQVSLMKSKMTSQEAYEAVEASAATAQADLDRARLSLESIETDQAALALIEQDISLADAQVRTDEISLASARQRLSETKVYAPFDGVISNRLVQEGQIIVSPTNNVNGGTALLTLTDLSRVYVVASVDESDVGRIQVDQSVTITSDAHVGTKFRGRVVRIATRGIVASNVVTFDVQIEVVTPNKSLLKLEMTADVKILVLEEPDVLLVPLKLVKHRHGKSIVLAPPAEAGGSPEGIEVVVGADDGTQVKIVSGVTEGQLLMIPDETTKSRWAGRGARGGGEGGGNRPHGGGDGMSTRRLMRTLR